MAQVVVVLLLVLKLASAYVLYQQELGLVPVMPVNPYAIAQRNDLINKLNQLLTCPICCESRNEKNEDDEKQIDEVIYSPVDEELEVLNIVPLKTTERSTTNGGEQQMQRTNEIVKEFMGKTVKKEKAENFDKQE